MPSMTTTKQGMFRVEDITFKNPRQQSEVEKEIARDKGVSPAAAPVPVSMTPESIKTFYEKKVEDTADSNEKAVFNQTIQWIDELFALRKKVVQLELKIPKDAPEPMDDDIDADTTTGKE